MTVHDEHKALGNMLQLIDKFVEAARQGVIAEVSIGAFMAIRDAKEAHGYNERPAVARKKAKAGGAS